MLSAGRHPPRCKERLGSPAGRFRSTGHNWWSAAGVGGGGWGGVQGQRVRGSSRGRRACCGSHAARPRAPTAPSPPLLLAVPCLPTPATVAHFLQHVRRVLLVAGSSPADGMQQRAFWHRRRRQACRRRGRAGGTARTNVARGAGGPPAALQLVVPNRHPAGLALFPLRKLPPCPPSHALGGSLIGVLEESRSSRIRAAQGGAG